MMQESVDFSLGRFGDHRLDKGGLRCSSAWLRARRLVCDSSADTDRIGHFFLVRRPNSDGEHSFQSQQEWQARFGRGD